MDRRVCVLLFSKNNYHQRARRRRWLTCKITCCPRSISIITERFRLVRSVRRVPSGHARKISDIDVTGSARRRRNRVLGFIYHFPRMGDVPRRSRRLRSNLPTKPLSVSAEREQNWKVHFQIVTWCTKNWCDSARSSGKRIIKKVSISVYTFMQIRCAKSHRETKRKPPNTVFLDLKSGDNFLTYYLCTSIPGANVTFTRDQNLNSHNIVSWYETRLIFCVVSLEFNVSSKTTPLASEWLEGSQKPTSTSFQFTVSFAWSHNFEFPRWLFWLTAKRKCYLYVRFTLRERTLSVFEAR